MLRMNRQIGLISFFMRYSDMNPLLIEREMHLHTNFTDGEPSVAQVIRHAEEIGLTKIAFTEHVRSDSAWFQQFAEEVRRCAASSKIHVLIAAEARIMDFNGTLDISSSIRRQCDFIIGSVHRFPGKNEQLLDFADIPREEFADIEFRLSIGFLRNGSADVLAHPGGMSQRHLGAFPDNLYTSLMAESLKAGMAIEINSSYINNLTNYLALLEKINPWISIASDAHRLDEIGSCRDKIKEILWNN